MSVDEFAPGTPAFFQRMHHGVDASRSESDKEPVEDFLVAIQHLPPPVWTGISVGKGRETDVCPATVGPQVRTIVPSVWRNAQM